MLSKTLYIFLIFCVFCVSVNAEDKSAERLVELEEKLTKTSFDLSNYSLPLAYRLAFEVSRNFTSSELARVSIDNYNGNFIVDSLLTASNVRKKDWTNVVFHGEKALQFRTDNGVASAPDRFSRLLMNLARAYNTKCFRNYDLADEYQDWALEIDPDNAQLQQKLAIEKFEDELRNKNFESAEKILSETIQESGLPKRMVYKVFGAFLWQQGKRKECFELWLNALKDMRLDYHENSRELGIESIKKTIAYADLDQLYEYEALLKTLPARYPAIIKYAPAIAGLMRIANDPELQDEIFLRKAEKEFTPEMEQKLRKFIKTKRYKISRAYLYLGDNLLAQGFGNEAIDIWFEGFKKYGNKRFSKGMEDWFSDRISNNLKSAKPEQIEKYADMIVSLTGTNVYANANARFNACEKLVKIGKTEKAINVCLDGLEMRRQPWIHKSEGDWFIQKLDSNTANLTSSQKKRYTKIIKNQIEKWKGKKQFAEAIPWLKKKLKKLEEKK